MKRLTACCMLLIWMSIFISPLLSPSAAAAAPPREVQADAGKLSVIFVGNTQVTLEVTVGRDLDPTTPYVGVLTRDGTALRRSGRGFYTYRDHGLTKGQSYTYALSLYLEGELVQRLTATIVAGEVRGRAPDGLVMSGEWTLYGAMYGDAATLAPGATLRSNHRDLCPVHIQHFTIDNATVISTTIESTSYPYTPDSVLSVQSSTLEDVNIAAGDITVIGSTLINVNLQGIVRRLEDNTGSCATGGYGSVPVYDAPTVIKNNQLPGCALSLNWSATHHYQPPQALSVVENDFVSLRIRGDDATTMPIEVRDNTFSGGPNVATYGSAVLLEFLRGEVSVTGNVMESLESWYVTGPETIYQGNTITLTHKTWSAAVEVHNGAGLVFKGNTITCREDEHSLGLVLSDDGSSILVVDNVIRDCDNGIDVASTPMTYTHIVGNLITGGDAWDSLIRIYDSGGAPHSVRDNIVTCEGDEARNYGYGIQLEGASNVEVTGNVVRNCGEGLRVEGGNFTQPAFPPASGNVLRDNMAIDNKRSLVFESAVRYSTVVNNLFRKRAGADTQNFRWDWAEICVSTCYNTWDEPKSRASEGNVVGGPYYGGNYWSDYTGLDGDGDKLGDTPYTAIVPWEADDLPLIGAPGPDLFVKPFSLDLTRVTLTPNAATIPAEVMIFNVGEETADGVQLTVVDNAGQERTFATSDIIAGSQRTVTFDWDITELLVSGGGGAEVVLDALARITGSPSEYNLSNNRAGASALVDAQPRILDVNVQYPLDTHRYFSGPSLPNKLDVTVDWNGELPGSGSAPYGDVVFDLNGTKTTVTGESWGGTHTYDMGTDMRAGMSGPNNTLSIRAQVGLSGYDITSDPHVVQATVYTMPDWITWAKENLSGDPEYTVTPKAPLATYDYNFRFPEEPFEAVHIMPEWLPAIGGSAFGIEPTQARLLTRSRSDGPGTIFTDGMTGFTWADDTTKGEVTGEGKTWLTPFDNLQLKSAQFNLSINHRKSQEVSPLDICGMLTTLLDDPVVGRAVRWLDETGKITLVLHPDITIDTGIIEKDGTLVFDYGTGTGSVEMSVAYDAKVMQDVWFHTYGGGTPAITVHVPKDEVEGYLEALALDLLFRSTLKAWSFQRTFQRGITCRLPGECRESESEVPDGVRLSTSGAREGWGFIPRDYVDDASYGRFTTSTRAALSSDADQTLVTNIYPYPEPDMALSGSGRALIAYVHDDADDPVGRGTEIMALIDTGSGWSAPVALTADAQPDYAPAVAFDGSGNGVVIWERSTLAADVTPELDTAFAQSLEISARAWNGLTWTAPVALTDNSLMDHAPQLSTGADGSTMALWQTNDGTDILGTAAHPVTLNTALWDGASWSSVTPAITGLEDILDVAFAMRNSGEAAVIYNRDMDGDLNSVEDTELFYAAYNGTWSAPVRLTNNAVPDTHPALAYDGTGRRHLLWLQNSAGGSTALMHLTASWNPNAAEVVQLDGLPGDLTGFEPAQDLGGNLALIWPVTVDGGGALAYTIYDGDNEAWRAPTTLAGEATPDIETGFVGAFDSSGALHAAYQIIETTSITTSVDISPTLSVTVTNVPQPGRSDLAYLVHDVGRDLAWDGLTVEPANPAPGTTVTLTAVLRNAGDLTVNAPQVQLLEGATPIVTPTLGALDGGMTTTVKTTYKLPDTQGSVTLTAVADSNSALDELDETNNTVTRTVVLPDLAVDLVATVVEDGAMVATVRVVNQGGLAASETFSVTLYAGDALAPDTGALLAAPELSEDLEVGEVITLTETFTAATGLSAGVDTLWATVDAGETVSEVDEGNNAGFAALRMQPDLTLSAADISGDGPLVVTVHNEGPVDANGVLVELRDGGETGAMLDRQTLPSVAAGGSAAFLAAAPTGAYTLYVTVDPDNTIDEAAEGNNLAIRDVEVFSRIYLPLTLR